MSSDKRDFTDFKKFPGSIVARRYTFPSLYYKDSSGKTRIWTINVRLVKDSATGNRPKHSHDWDLLKENEIPIIPEYLAAGKLPPNVSSQFWVETGIIEGKISRHPPSYSNETNVGRSNERNVFKQSLVDARSKYLKKYEEGGRTKKEFEGKIKPQGNKMFFPMLARKFNEDKKHVVWPALGQPKLDGVRCIAFLNVNPNRKTPSYKDVILATRQQKTFMGFDHIRMLLLNPLIEMYHTRGFSLYLDGEFYKHGKHLQEISGEVRNIEKNSKVTKNSVQYHVFDCFYPNELTTPFKERVELLEDFFRVYDINSVDWTDSNLEETLREKDMVTMVPTEEIEDEKSFLEIYKNWVSQKYEGAMYRNPDGSYLAHPTKTGTFLRSHDLLKLKMRYDSEFELVGFTEGTKGRDKGAIMWICKTSNGTEFHVTPKNTTLKDRYELFKKITQDKNFNQEYKGRLMTIEYEDLSKDGVPLRAKSVGIRDYE
jgi:ATP-dependent DNA ligase